MSITDSDIAFVHELFDGVGGLSHRKMMGGLTIYADGRIFAILDSESTPYLKAKGPLADELAATGAHEVGEDAWQAQERGRCGT